MCPRSCSVERTRENGGNRGMVDEEEEEEEDEWCQFPHLQPRAELRRNQRGEISTQSLTLTTEY